MLNNSTISSFSFMQKTSDDFDEIYIPNALNNSFHEGMPRNFTNLIQRINYIENYENPPFDIEKNLTVNINNTKGLTLYSVKTFLIEVEKMTRALFPIISTDVRKKYGKDLEEFQAVFIKDHYEGWLFLRIEALKLCEIALYESKEKKMVERQDTIDGKDDRVFIRRNTIIEKKEKTQPKKNKWVIKINEFPAAKSSSLLARKKKRSIVGSEKFQLIIQDGALNCDIFKLNNPFYNACRKQIRMKHKESNIWKTFSSKFYKSILSSSLVKYFENFTSEKFSRFSKSVLKIFLCEVDKDFKNDIKKIHVGLGISINDFNKFRNIFKEDLQSFISDQNETKIIMTNLDLLRDAIVD
ncbi:hypothetical protein SteCoe_6588 [Stentor coeruleus]|uniref:Uncharacterized protein n=1 Tax=Stentor coeruleus TaxID=5963 RepID=A0A1R2CPK0_9CILI|nr:hypothetical protein SteCoe_6588 [Stentor coeruleus]